MERKADLSSSKVVTLSRKLAIVALFGSIGKEFDGEWDDV
jgi:hypothetical protein